MDRRRALSSRPASSEEVEFWTHAAKSLNVLADKYATPNSLETIGRVNRLISAWPADDVIPGDGFDSVKTTYKKLTHGLNSIKTDAESEVRAIDEAIEQLEVILALRKATESSPLEKRKQRPRGNSPANSNTNSSSMSTRGMSITLPARASVGPAPNAQSSREVKGRQPNKQMAALQEGRRVAFHPPPGKSNAGGDTDENTWILAIVTRCISVDKQRYEVKDAEPQEDGQPGALYTTTIRSIIPLPDPDSLPGNSYPEFSPGSTVMALYPDTSCFYRAEVIATPRASQPAGRGVPSSKHMPTYKLKFEDDDGQEHTVAAQWVVEWPGYDR